MAQLGEMWKQCIPNVSPCLTGVHHPTTSCLSVYTVHVSPLKTMVLHTSTAQIIMSHRCQPPTTCLTGRNHCVFGCGGWNFHVSPVFIVLHRPKPWDMVYLSMVHRYGRQLNLSHRPKQMWITGETWLSWVKVIRYGRSAPVIGMCVNYNTFEGATVSQAVIFGIQQKYFNSRTWQPSWLLRQRTQPYPTILTVFGLCTQLFL